MKKCSKCGGVYPLTTTYWNRDKTNKGGFHNYCKEWYRNQYFYDAIREAKLLEYVEGKRLKRFYT